MPHKHRIKSSILVENLCQLLLDDLRDLCIRLDHAHGVLSSLLASKIQLLFHLLEQFTNSIR
jgi:hypothetical protein